jgi:hypothetical protein
MKLQTRIADAFEAMRDYGGDIIFSFGGVLFPRKSRETPQCRLIGIADHVLLVFWIFRILRDTTLQLVWHR